MSEVALGCLLPFESVAFEAGVALKHRITPACPCAETRGSSAGW